MSQPKSHLDTRIELDSLPIKVTDEYFHYNKYVVRPVVQDKEIVLYDIYLNGEWLSSQRTWPQVRERIKWLKALSQRLLNGT